MNKKNLAFLLLGVLAFAGFGSAMLIAYISNSVTAEVSVESPLVMTIVGGDAENNLVLTGVYGGDVIAFSTSTENMASVDINGNYEIIVSNDLDNATCEDFTVATFNGADILIGCEDIDGQAVFGGARTYGLTSTVTDNVALTFALNIAPADYTIQSQVEMA